MSRLIDADALKESIVTETLEKDRENITRRLCYPCREIFTAIDKAPTIEERKTGRWEDIHIDVANDDKGRSYRFYVCTACGVTSIPAMLAMEKKWLKYCPNCGAKMEGQDD